MVEKHENAATFDEVPVESPGSHHVVDDAVRDVDEALKFLRLEATASETDALSEKKLLRKIDRMIIPIMFFVYGLQYLDKTLINYASVMGLLDDAHLTSDEYSNLALFFYVSYLFFELPHGYLMQRLPTAKYLGSMVILWGIVVACTSACNSYGSLTVVRLLLGCFESCIAPGLILLSSMWFKKREQPPRIGLWYFGVGSAVTAGSLMSFGFQHYHGEVFKSWQIMFLVVGCVTIFVGILVLILLPDNPMTSRLSHAEKVLAVERVRENHTGIENKHFKLNQVKECFADPQTWLIAGLTTSLNIPNAATSSFQSLIIKQLGFSSEQTALLQIPSGVIAVVSVLTATMFAGYFNKRWIFIVAALAISGLLGGSLLSFLPSHMSGGRLAGIYITNVGGASLPVTYSLVSANFAGHTKKVTMNAVLLMSFCLGNILGPLTFQGKDAPEYEPAKITIVATSAAAIAFALLLVLYYRWENGRRNASHLAAEHKQDIEFADLTDKENKEFRYRY